MTTWIVLIVLMICAYLLGSVPMSYLLGKRRGIDLRNQGTHQVGTGNLWRTTSRKLGIFVGLFDLFKGILMIGVAYCLGLDAGQQLIVGMMAMIGHNWPVFLHFHGGRGIAALAGLAIIIPILNDISPWPTVIALGCTLGGTAILKSSPIPVLVSVISLPIANWLFGSPLDVVLAYVAIFLVVILKRLTAQAAPEKRIISRGRLIFNRLVFDRDIADGRAWVQRKHFDEKEILE
jgi:glycerol-3-phosphate acyltransferase PlsY